MYFFTPLPRVNKLKIMMHNFLISIQDVIEVWIFNDCNTFFIHQITSI